MKREHKKRFELINQMLPLLKEFMQDDILCALSDTEKFLTYVPGNHLQFPQDITNTHIQEGDPIIKALATKEIVVGTVPEEVFGLPFKAIAYPLIDQAGNAFGAVGIGKSLKVETDISTSVQKIQVKLTDAMTQTSDVSTAISDITNEMESNSAATQEALAGIEEISSMASVILEEVDQTKVLSDTMKVNAEMGSESIEKINTAMDAITSSSKDVSSLIHNLDDSIKKIESIVDIINGISEQTNLLALNAAIEAARAGEQGKGFAVVADEVRKLAEESKASTIEIRSLVESIQSETALVENAVKKTEEFVQSGGQSSIEVNENFSNILESVKGVDQQVTSVLDRTTMQTVTSKEIAQAIESITQAIMATTSKSSEIQQSTQALNEAIEGINSDTADIVDTTAELFHND